MKAIKRNRLASMGNSLYDAAKFDSQRDNTFLAWPMFPEKEFTQFTRETILKKKRLIEANLPLVSAMIQKVGRYSIGNGLFPVPETNDPEWNDNTREDFIEWANNPTVCDAMGRWTFWEMQKYMAEALFGENEAFAALVHSAQVGSPQVQCFDNFEVRYVGSSGAAPASLAPGQFTYWDGVKLNRNSKVVAYSIQTTDGGGFQDVDVEDMIHVANMKRPGQYRALSPFHAGANSAIDALDIKGLEVATIKLHSILAVVYAKNTGKGVGEQGLSGQLRDLLNTTVEPDGTEKATGRTDVGEDFPAGAAIVHPGIDEKIELLTSDRPSINLIQYLEWLYRDVAVSTTLPLEIVWNLSDLGGANSRITLADAQFLFDAIQGKIAHHFCRKVYIWWLSIKMNNGYAAPKNSPRWWAHRWQGPAKLTADNGRQVTSDIQALDSAMTTLHDYHGSRGANWKPKIKQRIEEVKYAMAECADQKVPYEKVFPPKAGAAGGITIGTGVGGGNPGEPSALKDRLSEMLAEIQEIATRLQAA